MALAKSQKSLKAWTKQKWRTKSGKPSTQGPKATGERYLPSAAIKNLSSSEYAATTRAKRKAKRLKESKIRRQVLNKANSNKVLIERFQKLANIKK